MNKIALFDFLHYHIGLVMDRELCMIKNGDDTNVLGTIATFAPSD